MSLQTSARAIVHIVDDDASLRVALEELFESVGLKDQIAAKYTEVAKHRKLAVEAAA